MFSDNQAAVPPAQVGGETDRTDAPLAGAARKRPTEDPALSGSDDRRSPRTKGGEQ